MGVKLPFKVYYMLCTSCVHLKSIYVPFEKWDVWRRGIQSRIHLRPEMFEDWARQRRQLPWHRIGDSKKVVSAVRTLHREQGELRSTSRLLIFRSHCSDSNHLPKTSLGIQVNVKRMQQDHSFISMGLSLLIYCFFCFFLFLFFSPLKPLLAAIEGIERERDTGEHCSTDERRNAKTLLSDWDCLIQ